MWRNSAVNPLPMSRLYTLLCWTQQIFSPSWNSRYSIRWHGKPTGSKLVCVCFYLEVRCLIWLNSMEGLNCQNPTQIINDSLINRQTNTDKNNLIWFSGTFSCRSFSYALRTKTTKIINEQVKKSVKKPPKTNNNFLKSYLTETHKISFWLF